MIGETVYFHKYWGDETVPEKYRHRYCDTKRYRITEGIKIEDLSKLFARRDGVRRSRKNRAMVSTELMKGRLGVVVRTRGEYHQVMWNTGVAQLNTWVPRELLKVLKTKTRYHHQLIEMVEDIKRKQDDYDKNLQLFADIESALQGDV